MADPGVEGDKRHLEGFGEGDVGGFVGREVGSEPPDRGQERLVRMVGSVIDLLAVAILAALVLRAALSASGAVLVARLGEGMLAALRR